MDKNKLKFSKKIVILCITFIILYTIIQLILSYMLSIELSPTLTTCVYAFFGTELATCAVIKIFDKQEQREKIDTKRDINNEDSVG